MRPGSEVATLLFERPAEIAGFPPKILYAILACDLVRHAASHLKISEQEIWEHVDIERASPKTLTTDYETPEPVYHPN
jgi:hypothetical protein